MWPPVCPANSGQAGGDAEVSGRGIAGIHQGGAQRGHRVRGDVDLPASARLPVVSASAPMAQERILQISLVLKPRTDAAAQL